MHRWGRLSGDRARWSRVRRAAAVAVAAAALASSSALAGIPTAHAQSSALPAEITRYAGDDRYATSLAVARALLAEHGGATEWAVMVSGRSWPDAVVAASLAGALDAPILLSPPDELLEETSDFLWAAEISKILVVGPSKAPGISNSLVAELTSSGYAVERVAGSDRSATSVAVAERLGEILRDRSGAPAGIGSMPGFGPTAIVASSEVFADALVSGPVSAYGEHPVLLTSPQRLDAGVAGYLDEAGVEHVVLMGGTAALERSVERALSDLGLEVTRLGGATRFETAVLLAELVHERYAGTGGRACFTHAEVGLARARVPFDSFSAGPLLAHRCGSLVLTDPRKPSAATQRHLAAARASIAASDAGRLDVSVFGGTAAVTDGVLREYFGHEAGPAETVSLTHACFRNGPERVPLDITAPMYRATWSPDCSRVLFLRLYNELWIADRDGSNARRLLPSGTRAFSPAWSPDGSRIAFAQADFSDGVAAKHIHLVDADGSGRRQLTSGDVNDESPSWSPDGTHLVFQRRDGVGSDFSPESFEQDQHLVVLNIENGHENSVFAGGESEFSPAWSPDGRRFAYTTWTELWVVDADGTDARILTDDGRTYRGVSWSPDSKRLATVRFRADELGGPAVVIVDVEGIGEELIPIPNLPETRYARYLPDRAPHWTPDGQRLFLHLAKEDPFTTRASSATNWIQFMSAPSNQVPERRTCKLPSRSDSYTTGFPLPSWSPSPVGTLRVAVLFVDFSDANVHYNTRDESWSSLRYIVEYFEHSSGGRLDVELLPHYQWLRAEHEVDHYVNERFYNGLLDEPISQHAVELADDDVDFSNIDIVLVVMPSTYFGDGGNEGGTAVADGNSMRLIRLNHRREGSGTHADGTPRTPSVNPWGRTAVHEMLHSLGLRDLYWEHTLGFRLWPIGDPLAPPPLPEGDYWALMEFGMMQLNGYDQVTGPNLKDRRLEMLTWSRWQLGWIDDSQVECVSADSTTVWLRAAAEARGETVMAAIQVSSNSAIVIESRRLIGYDEPTQFRRQSVASGDVDPQYLAEGVLVYTVNSLRGEHPVSLVQDNGRAYLSDFPLLDVGESVTVAGYTITVVEDTGSEHLVSIRKND